MLSDETSERKGQVLKQKTRSSTNMTKAYLLNTPPQDFHAGCVVFLIADPRVYETELLSNPTKNNYNLSCCRGHSRLGYSFWASNGKRTFLDNFTCLVCLDLYCEAYFGAYLHFILHIEYTNKVNLEGIGSSMISF
jgi:hypothetical protein